RFEPPPSGHPVGWLLLDVDREAVREATRADGAGRLSREETLLMPLHRPEHYSPRLRDLLQWLGRPWVYRIPRSRRTEAIRPLGRQREHARANAYPTLTELNYFFDAGSPFPGEKALGLSPADHGVPTFDAVHLVDFGDIYTDEDVESGSRLVAEYVYLSRGTA